MVNSYTEDLRLVRSLLIVTSLQKQTDLKALEISGNLPLMPGGIL